MKILQTKERAGPFGKFTLRETFFYFFIGDFELRAKRGPHQSSPHFRVSSQFLSNSLGPLSL